MESTPEVKNKGRILESIDNTFMQQNNLNETQILFNDTLNYPSRTPQVVLNQTLGVGYVKLTSIVSESNKRQLVDTRGIPHLLNIQVLAKKVEDRRERQRKEKREELKFLRNDKEEASIVGIEPTTIR